MIARFTLELEWQAFNIDLAAMETWFKANAGADYCGSSADTNLKLHFTAEPTQAIKDAIQTKWDSLTEISDEAVSYKSYTTLSSEKETAKASGKAKLAALGLTAEEIDALLN